jgi:hypothetical protein
VIGLRTCAEIEARKRLRQTLKARQISGFKLRQFNNHDKLWIVCRGEVCVSCGAARAVDLFSFALRKMRYNRRNIYGIGVSAI